MHRLPMAKELSELPTDAQWAIQCWQAFVEKFINIKPKESK